MEQLRDIKGLVVISDYSWMWVMLITLFILGCIGWILWKLKRTQKGLLPKEKAINHLREASLEDAKTCAYLLTQWGAYIVDENNQKMFDMLEEKLKNYKYRACDTPLSDEEKMVWQQFLGSIDANI